MPNFKNLKCDILGDFLTLWRIFIHYETMMILVTKKTTTDVCAKYCGRNITFAVAIFARFWPDSLCGFAFLVDGDYFCAKLPCFCAFLSLPWATEERLIFIWELFEFGSHDGMCVLDIENNDQLQDLELHSQRKLPKSQTRFCHKLVRLFIHQMRDFLDENWPKPEIFPICDSKGCFCYDNKLLVKINDVFQNLISSTLFFQSWH